MNDVVGDGKAISYIKNKDALQFNQMSDEEKGYGMVGTAHAVPHAETTPY